MPTYTEFPALPGKDNMNSDGDREPFDVGEYEQMTRSGGCFICRFLQGDPDKRHIIVAEDDAHVAFLDRYPTVPGKVIAAPRAHVEHVVRDLNEAAFVALMGFVRRVALAVEETVPCERTYLYSLGSQQGNSHVHWHIAALPPRTPYRQQQFAAIMTEHGVLRPDQQRDEVTARRVRQAFSGL